MGKSNFLASLCSKLLKTAVVLLVLTIPFQFHIDSFKYPGAQALAKLHVLNTSDNDSTFINVDISAVNSGAIGFARTKTKWVYFVEEEPHDLGHYFMYDYMLVPNPSFYESNFDVLGTFKGCRRLQWMSLQDWLDSVGPKAKAVRDMVRDQAKVEPKKLWYAVVKLLPFKVMVSDQMFLLKKREESIQQ